MLCLKCWTWLRSLSLLFWLKVKSELFFRFGAYFNNQWINKSSESWIIILNHLRLRFRLAWLLYKWSRLLFGWLHRFFHLLLFFFLFVIIFFLFRLFHLFRLLRDRLSCLFHLLRFILLLILINLLFNIRNCGDLLDWVHSLRSLLELHNPHLAIFNDLFQQLVLIPQHIHLSLPFFLLFD